MAGKMYTNEALQHVLELAKDGLQAKRNRVIRMEQRIRDLQERYAEGTKEVEYGADSIAHLQMNPLVEQYPTADAWQPIITKSK